MQFFYYPDLSSPHISFSPEESKHCIKVLRKKIGDLIWITDGKGNIAKAQLISDNIHCCVLQILEIKNTILPDAPFIHVAVAPTKNVDRMEWLIEKAVEIGANAVSFIICERSERTTLDLNRMNRIAISALKQSNAYQLPDIQIMPYKDFIINDSLTEGDKFVAWCDDDNDKQLINVPLLSNKITMLIGPEGDFSPNEIEIAKNAHFTEIKLGNKRLRTETAAMVALTILVNRML